MASLDPTATPPIATASLGLSEPSWFRSRRYDLSLTLGVLFFALLLGGIGLLSTTAFAWVLLLDIWLLAHPHVTAMYTRIAFDRRSRRQYWFLLLGLPPLVLLATVATTWFGGALALFTLYYFWQTWHYTRQSYGIARAIQRSTDTPADPVADKAGETRQRMPGDRLSSALIYAFPIWGLLRRSHQRPSTFYKFAIVFPPVPASLVTGVGIVAVGLLVAWSWQRLSQWRRGQASFTHSLFVLSHVAITSVSYLLVEDITAGWLFINIWHNAQYMVFVWHANARRFEPGIDPEMPFLSKLSQPSNAVHYVAVCVVLGAAFYLVLGWITQALVTWVVSAVLVGHLAVNFHHYVVDAVIWRRKPHKLT